jgi:protease II
MAEYGNTDTDNWENFLHKFSPYQNIDESVTSYPPILFTTFTRDDRVHLGHAQKMVKKPCLGLGQGQGLAGLLLSMMGMVLPQMPSNRH